PVARSSPPQVSTLSLHDALPISECRARRRVVQRRRVARIGEDRLLRSVRKRVQNLLLIPPAELELMIPVEPRIVLLAAEHLRVLDRKSTRLNSSHRTISYAVFCL